MKFPAARSSEGCFVPSHRHLVVKFVPVVVGFREGEQVAHTDGTVNKSERGWLVLQKEFVKAAVRAGAQACAFAGKRELQKMMEAVIPVDGSLF
jgi:hypothetical protein